MESESSVLAMEQSPFNGDGIRQQIQRSPSGSGPTPGRVCRKEGLLVQRLKTLKACWQHLFLEKLATTIEFLPDGPGRQFQGLFRPTDGLLEITG